MISPEHESLWKRIEAFSLDEPGVQFPFSQRLARENRWTIAHAQRAIEEYKRFMFLGCVAGHPVSPSEDVDQVWHLHLAYTQSYWTDFCGKILGRPFHHCPTKGGEAESAKFADWYAKTLQSYRRFFGEEPPRDIWPPHPVHHDLSWIDRSSHWIVRKPSVAAVTLALASSALFIAAGCAGSGGWNIFDYRGPDFLRFYVWFAIAGFIGALLVRRLIMSASERPASIGDPLLPYDIAFLAGGKPRATVAAMVALAAEKIITINGHGDVELAKSIPPDAARHPLEKTLLAGCVPGMYVPFSELKKRTTAVLNVVRYNLAQKGLVFETAAAARAQWIAFVIAMAVPAVGVTKVFLGIVRGKPVVYLVIETMITFAIAACFARAPFRTSAGSRFLRDLRDQNGNLYTQGPIPSADASMLPLAIGLFGLDVLANTSYAHLQRPLQRKDVAGGNSSGCDSSCGSSNSSSSCSGGGSSCGGGGGCGGCGGGGGD